MTADADTSVDEEAIAWFVLLRDDSLSADDRARFTAWLEADSRNRRAWREIEAMWSGMDHLRPANDSFAGRGAQRAGGAARDRWWLAAAAVLLVICGAGYWTVQPPGFGPALFADHRTAPDGTETVTLPDGSHVVLAASSALSVDFDGAARRVTLHQGEGYFSVVPDAAHPFVVAAADGTVTVVGTEFDVKLADDRVAVAVASGVVEVAAQSGAAVRLIPGQSVRYDSAGIAPLRTVDPADIGFWRSGRLVFQAAPLGEVLRDLERYRRGRIVVTDSAIAALPVTGVFDTRRTGAALDTIAHTLPVQLTYVTDLLVLVGPAD